MVVTHGSWEISALRSTATVAPSLTRAACSHLLYLYCCSLTADTCTFLCSTKPSSSCRRWHSPCWPHCKLKPCWKSSQDFASVTELSPCRQEEAPSALPIHPLTQNFSSILAFLLWFQTLCHHQIIIFPKKMSDWASPEMSFTVTKSWCFSVSLRLYSVDSD